MIFACFAMNNKYLFQWSKAALKLNVSFTTFYIWQIFYYIESWLQIHENMYNTM